MHAPYYLHLYTGHEPGIVIGPFDALGVQAVTSTRALLGASTPSTRPAGDTAIAGKVTL